MLEDVTEPLRPNLPPGWPTGVLPPGTDGWEETAIRWLWRLVPADYQQHQLLRDEPRVLARLARQTVESQLSAMRSGYRTMRADMADLLEPRRIEDAMQLYAWEGSRLRELAQQVHLVEEALVRGVRWRPAPRPEAGGSRRHGGMG